jgi:SOS-response transcriptional repressor LexA
MYMLQVIDYSRLHIPYLGIVSAGFASPVDEESMDVIRIDEYAVRDRDASFLLRMEGDRLKDQGICHGDLIIFERGVNPTTNQLSVVSIEGEGYQILYPSEIKAEHLTGAVQIIGIVVSVIRRYVP